MSVRNRNSYSNMSGGRNRSWNLLRGAGILLILALLSFSLGFFVLSRLPQFDRPTNNGGSGNVNNARENNASSRLQSPSPSVSSSRRTTQRTEPARPGPTIDPEETNTLQKPENLDSSGVQANGATRDNGEAGGTDANNAVPPSGGTGNNTADPGQSSPRNETAAASDSPRRRDRKAVQAPSTPDGGHTVGSTTAPAPAGRVQSSENTGETAASSGLFRVQIGVYSTKEAAELEARRLADRGINATVHATTSGGRALYRLQHGAFRNRVNAEAARDKLKSSGVDSIVQDPN